MTSKTVTCLLLHGYTIQAAIRLHNFHDVTPEELELLTQRYVELNGSAVKRVGETAIIPILERHEAKLKG